MTKDTQRTSARILVVDDEPDLRTLYELTLLRAGHQVESAGTLAEARDSLSQRHFDLLITDMRLPDGLGLELIKELGQQGRSERAIVVTAYGSASSAVEALKQGAFDYLTKPLDLKQFRTVVATALQSAPASTDSTTPVATKTGDAPPATPATGQVEEPANSTPTAQTATATKSTAAPPRTGALAKLAGDSQAMHQVRERIVKVANSMAPVMILGESGTGKELVARAIHEASHRAQGPLVAVNCGAIPDALIEAEFFGARKGAYTGAATDREGYFAAARGGTLFLDEIGDLPLPMQAKLLRVIQERKVRPLGGVQEEQVDVRILCATHHDLVQAVAKQGFRQDLYYRLNVIEIRLPALRERRDDLPALTHTLMRRICSESGQHPVPLHPDALQWLHRHPFAGNVRELENLLHRALALCNGHEITLDDLLDPQGTCPPPPTAQTGAHPPQPATATPASPAWPGSTQPPSHPHQPDDAAATPPTPTHLPADLQQHLDEQEKAILQQALHATRGNRTAAAALLGLNLRQIRYRIARLNITVGGDTDAACDTSPHEPTDR